MQARELAKPWRRTQIDCIEEERSGFPLSPERTSGTAWRRFMLQQGCPSHIGHPSKETGGSMTALALNLPALPIPALVREHWRASILVAAMLVLWAFAG